MLSAGDAVGSQPRTHPTGPFHPLQASPVMSPPRQAVTARDLSPPPTPVRPSPLARASSIIAQHLPPAPSFPHFDFGSLSPGGGHADPKREPGTSSNGFHFDLPTIRVPEGMQNLKLPEFELPQMNLLPAWQQFRSRSVLLSLSHSFPGHPP